MNPTPFSYATILHFCRFLTLNVPAEFDIFQKQTQ